MPVLKKLTPCVAKHHNAKVRNAAKNLHDLLERLAKDGLDGEPLLQISARLNEVDRLLNEAQGWIDCAADLNREE